MCVAHRGDSTLYQEDSARPNRFPALRYAFWVPVMVFLLTMLATGIVRFTERKLLEKEAQHDLDLRTLELANSLHTRLDLFDLALLASRSLIETDPLLSRQKFHDFISGLQLDKTHPGQQGIGFSLRVAPQELDQHLGTR